MILALSLCLAGSPSLGQGMAEPSAAEASDCRLHIEGKFVAKLILADDKNQATQIDRPGPSVSLPAGRYYVQEVYLQGGYRARNYVSSPMDHDGGWFQLTPDKPCRLQVGAPLIARVEAKRQGRILKLDYELRDAHGLSYSHSLRTGPPRFAVYQGDRKIGSGTFEYG